MDVKYRLPREMKKQIMQNIIPRLERKKDVCVENLFYYLPEDISNAVKRYLCLDLLKKVSSYNLIPSSQLSLSLSLSIYIYIYFPFLYQQLLGVLYFALNYGLIQEITLKYSRSTEYERREHHFFVPKNFPEYKTSINLDSRNNQDYNNPFRCKLHYYIVYR